MELAHAETIRSVSAWNDFNGSFEARGYERPRNAYGAGGRIRTAYLLITNQLLYRLSYAGRNFVK